LTEPNASDDKSRDLFLRVYNELRTVAERKMNKERPNHTLSATALVHDAFVRMVDAGSDQTWENDNHFYAAAAEAMRRILVENARRKNSVKRGGEQHRVSLNEQLHISDTPSQQLLDLDEVLKKLEQLDPDKAEVVKLRYFAGLTIDETANVLKISPATVKRYWDYSKAWLHARLKE
jgi:RNA polymerase sigma factor (TIGR02999 family)